MSSFQAIGGVDATLRTLLRDRMELPADVPLNDLEVTIGPPRTDKPDGSPGEKARINLFLYRVTENGALKNQEPPGRGHPGAYGHPPLSLELHYLMTAYGTTDGGGFANEIRAHYLLGSAMRVFHDFAIVTEQLRTVRPPVEAAVLDQSLRGEFENIKLCLEPISLEDLSKVWTATTLPMRTSAAYVVSVVQIESRRARSYPQPVGELPNAGPRVLVVPFRHPQIDSLFVRRPGDPPNTERAAPFARLGDTLILRGRNFTREPVSVLIGTLSIPVTPLADDRIEVPVPDDILPGPATIPPEQRLQPGPHPIEVLVRLAGLPQTGFHSNGAVFMLVPFINAPPNATLNATPRTLQIDGQRLYNTSNPGETLIGRAVISKENYLTATPAQLIVSVPDTLPARAAQCLVSGSLAPFPNLPNGPQVNITIGADGPRTATFPNRPTNLSDAARALQTAIRNAPGGGPACKGARVSVAGDRLVIVPGGLPNTVAITFANVSGTNTTADLLQLTGSATTTQAYLSGDLTPFPSLTANLPQLRITFGGDTNPIALSQRPTTLTEAAAFLQNGLNAPAPPAFANARVTTLENQLLIVPGATVAMTIGPVVGTDETTMAELQLNVRYPVRVRVNGAESIDNVGVNLP